LVHISYIKAKKVVLNTYFFKPELRQLALIKKLLFLLETFRQKNYLCSLKKAMAFRHFTKVVTGSFLVIYKNTQY
jgi:hypothetical protein